MSSKWIPSAERSTIGAFVLSGTFVGTIVSFPLSGWLCDLEFDNGWPLSFYVPAAMGFLLFIGWVFLVYDNPAVHPRIDEEEKTYILATSGKSAKLDVCYSLIYMNADVICNYLLEIIAEICSMDKNNHINPCMGNCHNKFWTKLGILHAYFAVTYLYECDPSF